MDCRFSTKGERMKLNKLALSGLIALGCATAASGSRPAIASTSTSAASHPTTNIWAYAMKEVFQPEVDKLLKEGGAKYQVRWRENYGGTLYKFNETRAAVKDGIVDVGMVGTVWENSSMPLQNVTYFTPFATTNHELLIEHFRQAQRQRTRAQGQLDRAEHGAPVVADHRQLRHLRQLPGDQHGQRLQNKKIHAPGTSANWMRDTGATPVEGALTTYYTNIQTGVTQGALSFASGIGPARVLRSGQAPDARGCGRHVLRQRCGQQKLL
jgi:TRAP-type C4-dicarboxylate transport system substrate-binding protein